ncbi:hypothetical protein DFH29DRAFT_1000431 [Suillus ampliporus]|nr:hypothetical protein DFH29DRAFT_1000431 [Suillus ampliporus]
MTSKTVSHLNDAIQHLVLDQCYIQNDIQDIDSITFLFLEALALRLKGHPDHPPSTYHLVKVLIWCYAKENFTVVYIHESAQLFCKLFPLCPEGTYLHNIVAEEQWGAVVAEIRNLKGFSRFLLALLNTELQAAARHGPVTILITHAAPSLS